MRLLVTTIYTQTKRKLFSTSVITARTSRIVNLASDATGKEILDEVAAAIDAAKPSPEYVLTSVTHCVI